MSKARSIAVTLKSTNTDRLSAPGRGLVHYEPRVFDQGYGENDTDGHRVYYAGPPSPEIDEAWNALENGGFLASLHPVYCHQWC